MRLKVLTYAYREKITNSLRYQTNWLWCAAIAAHAVLALKLEKNAPNGGPYDVANDQGISNTPEYLRSMPVVTNSKASNALLPLPLSLLPPSPALLLVVALVRSIKATPRLTAVWSEWPDTPPSSKVRTCVDNSERAKENTKLVLGEAIND